MSGQKRHSGDSHKRDDNRGFGGRVSLLMRVGARVALMQILSLLPVVAVWGYSRAMRLTKLALLCCRTSVINFSTSAFFDASSLGLLSSKVCQARKAPCAS